MEEKARNLFGNGMHSDNDPRFQPEGTFRKGFNGRLIGNADGSFTWENMKGNKTTFFLPDTDPKNSRLIGWYPFRNMIIVWFTVEDGADKIGKFVIDNDGLGASYSEIYSVAANGMGFNLASPIRDIFGVYENENIQRIFWTTNGHPRQINIKSPPSDPKFLNWVPILSLGQIKFDSIINEGALLHGTYLFCFQLLTNDGYASDWSYMTSPIPITGYPTTGDEDDYQDHQGENFDQNTGKGIRLTINNIDTGFDQIRVGYFFSNDYNSAGPGVIEKVLDITASSMDIEIKGGEGIDTLSIEDVLISTMTLEKVKTFANIKDQRNAICNFTERAELSIGNKHFSDEDVQLYPEGYEIRTDQRGHPYDTGTITPPTALFGHKVGENKLFPGQWYKATSAMTFATDLFENLHGHAQSGTDADDLILQADHYNASGSYYSAANTVLDIWYYNTGSTLVKIDNATIVSYIPGTNTINFTAAMVNPDFTKVIRYHMEQKLGTSISDGKIFHNFLYIVPSTGTFIPLLRIKKYARKDSGHVGEVVYDDYDLSNEYLDYKGKTIASMAKGYWGKETYRLGLLPIDKYGKFMYPRWIDDFEVPVRNDEDSVLAFRPMIPYTTTNDSNGSYSAYWNINVMSIIINKLDLTDIIDDISGFAIVRAPRDKQILGEGLLMPTRYSGGGGDHDCYIQVPYWDQSGAIAPYPARKGNLYCFWTPEYSFGRETFTKNAGDVLEILNYFKQEKEKINWQDIGQAETTDAVYGKFFRSMSQVNAHANGVIGNTQNIQTRNVFTPEPKAQVTQIYYHPTDPDKYFKARAAWTIGIDHDGAGAKGLLFYITGDEGTDGVFGDYYDESVNKWNFCTCVAYKRPKGSLYGGTSNAALSNTQYIFTGHYQVVDQAFKDQIKSGSDYIVDNLQLFGGDCFICINDIARVQKFDNADSFGMSHLMPVQSSVNIALRQGVHAAKDRSHNGVTNPDGIVEPNWEEYNYNDAYSSESVGNLLPAYPLNFKNVTDHESMLRWSEEKQINETIDSFRRFLPVNFMPLGSKGEEVNNLKYRFNSLIYWQREAIGYVPFKERALTTASSFGLPVQLGTGDMFQRYDVIYDKIGNQHQFGLVETDTGFMWYDALRWAIISLDKNMAFNEDSIMQGVDNYLNETIHADILNQDRPSYGGGVLGFYDPRNKEVFFTFSGSGFSTFTIGINLKNKKFQGLYFFIPKFALTFNHYLYTSHLNQNLKLYFYIHNKGKLQEFYGTKADAYIEFIVKSPTEFFKKWEKFKSIGNENFFSKVKFTSIAGAVEENVISNSNVLTNRSYGYRRGKWLGSFPLIGRRRIADDDYITVTMTISSTRTGEDQVRLTEFLSEFIKAY